MIRWEQGRVVVDQLLAEASDVARAIPAATAIVNRAETLLGHMPPYF
jgi:hypothetical protein